MTASAADLAATVQKTHSVVVRHVGNEHGQTCQCDRNYSPCAYCRLYAEFRAALDALLSRCQEAERSDRQWYENFHREMQRAEAAEAERDEARKAQILACEAGNAWKRDCEAAEARVAELEAALRGCRELFVELRGDWSDNRGPCREGFAIIDAALQSGGNFVGGAGYPLGGSDSR